MPAKSANRGPTTPNATILFPTMLGLACYFVFMSLVESNAGTAPLVYRYFAGHWISKATTALAWVGAAALAAHARILWQQLRGRRTFEPVVDSALDEPAQARVLLDQLVQWDRGVQTHFRTRRFRAGLQFVERNGSSDGLNDELKYLADMDVQRQSDHYAFVRILIWATPLLGFLGTVLGISQALGSIQLGPGSEFQQMMNSLRDNLYVAFDTTALALTLSIGLMFCMFLVQRQETSLLAAIDQEAEDQFATWFTGGNQSSDHQIRAMHRIGKAMVAATHEMSQKQIEIWRRSIESAQSAWLQASRNTYELVDSHLGRTLQEALSQMSVQLAGTIRQLDQALDERARQWQDRLVVVSQQIVEVQQQTADEQRQATELLTASWARNEGVGELELGTLVDSLNLLSTRMQQFVQMTAEGAGRPTSERLRAVTSGLQVFDDLRGDRAA